MSAAYTEDDFRRPIFAGMENYLTASNCLSVSLATDDSHARLLGIAIPNLAFDTTFVPFDVTGDTS